MAVEWFRALLSKTLGELDADFAAYRISDAFMKLYRLFWDEFSGWYLEMVKPAYGQPSDSATMAATKEIFDSLLKMLHPFMPFVTEELWHALEPRLEGESIMVADMPRSGEFDDRIIAEIDLTREAITAVRSIRQQKNIPMKESLELRVVPDGNWYPEYAPLLVKMANLSGVTHSEGENPSAAAFLVKTTRYFVPMGDRVDTAAELARLEEELTYNEGFLESVMKKLSNERFVQSAPPKVVETENAKKTDAEAKIAALKERIAALR
jgi:valyl-tRNA synthetase